MLISKSSIIAQLAAQVLRATCHHYSGSEAKIERINKQVLIKGSKSQETAATSQRGAKDQSTNSVSAESPSLSRSRRQNGFFFEAIFEYLKYLERVYDENNLVLSLHLTSLNLILSSLLQERHQSTSKEDLAVFAEMASRSDKVCDERASNKPILQLFDKFCLLDANYLDIQQMFTLLLTQSLNFYFDEEDWVCLRDLQGYILTYSTQFIWHLYLLMTSKISYQRTMSIKFLARLLHSNQESHDLLLRILPQTLFHKVKANRQSIESLQWNFPQWVEFFTQIVPRNFNSATEQWNHEMREELTKKLLAAKNFFIETKKLNSVTLQSKERRELLLPVHEFSAGKRVVSRWKNLKWNYREFRVTYDCLAQEYLVGNYFLARLLVLPALDGGAEAEKPTLSMHVREP